MSRPNPYASPVERGGPERLRVARDAELEDEGVLYRRVRLGGEGGAVIEYSGRGFGYDAVRVDGKTAAWNWKWVWFVHRFDFAVPRGGDRPPAVLCVEVSPWLTIRRMTLEVDGRLVYEEGA